MTWKTLAPECEDAPPVGQHQVPTKSEQVLPVDPGHVRTLAHYTAMLEELRGQK